jgi:PilZ domain
MRDESFGNAPAADGFTPRAPRSGLRIPLTFHFDGGIAKGHSIDISESGVLAVFDQHLDVWVNGQLSLLVHGRPITIEARVARVDGLTAALPFRSMNVTNLTLVQNLIKQAREEPSLSS